MTVNTVLLTVDRFKELNDFEHDIKDGMVLMANDYFNASMGYVTLWKVYTIDEAVKKITTMNESAQKRISILETELYEIKNPKPIERTHPDFETMSILQFIKYKWSKK